MRKTSFLVACAVLAGSVSAAVPSWRLAYEKPGATNYVTAADNPTAIRVELDRSGDQWSGKVVNGEPGATVTALEVYSDDVPVDTENGTYRIYRYLDDKDETVVVEDHTLRLVNDGNLCEVFYFAPDTKEFRSFVAELRKDRELTGFAFAQVETEMGK